MRSNSQYAPLEGSGQSPHRPEAPTGEKPSLQSSYSRTFDPNKQSWKLFREQALRLIFTFAIVAGLILALKIYQDKGTVAHRQKTSFNVVITVLNLALGLNFLEAFKDMAKVLRWRVLANRQHTIRETDLILGGESLMKLLTLVWESRKPVTLFVCTIWIALNLLAQASIAMIGLTYSMDGGTDSTGITTRPGMVNVSKADCYYANGLCATKPGAPPEIVQSQAHTYGEITRGQNRCPYTTDQDIYNSPQNCTYFASQIRPEFAFRYSEYNPHDRARAYPYLTRRIVRASANNCYQYNESSSYLVDSQDGLKEEHVYNYKNETASGRLLIPRPNTAFDSTTYVYNGSLAPQDATLQSCGDRCIYIYAFRSYGTVTKRPNTFFQCEVTIGEVSNADQVAHKLPANTARLAAASIALTGRYTHPLEGGPMEWQQYQLFPYASYWETNNMTAEDVGSRMSEFALGSVAAMAILNPQTTIPGTHPTLGYHLSIEWQYVIALAASIAGVHCLLVALMLWIARPIVITDDSNLAVARLLKGLVESLGDGGGLLAGRDIAEVIQGEKQRVGYGVREGEAGSILEVGEGLQRRKELPEGKFPAGQYA